MFKFFSFIKKYKYLIGLLWFMIVICLPVIIVFAFVYAIIYGIISQVYKYKRLKYIVKNLDLIQKNV